MRLMARIGLLTVCLLATTAAAVMAQATGQITGVVTDGSGAEVASLRAKKFSLVKDRMTMEMAHGEPWQVEGQLIEKNYTVTSGGREVVRISQKWLAMRDKYAIEIADGIDVGLALAVVWAIDRWVERD